MASSAVSSLTSFEASIRVLSERIAKQPNDRQPVQEALLALKKDFSSLLTTNNKEIGSYNIVAGACYAELLPRIPTSKVQEELARIKTSADAEAALAAIKQEEWKQVDETASSSAAAPAPKKQGWGIWFWGMLPAFAQAIANRVMGWSPEERQELKDGLKKIMDSK